MNLVNKFSSFLLIGFLVFLFSCKDSNPLSPLTKDRYDISIKFSDSNSLSGNVEITNRTDYNWKQTDLELLIKDRGSGKAHTQKLEFGDLKKDNRRGAAFFTDVKVQHPLCYSYDLSVIPEGHNEKITNEDGTCL